MVTLFKRGEQSAAVIRVEMPLKETLVAALPPPPLAGKEEVRLCECPVSEGCLDGISF